MKFYLVKFTCLLHLFNDRTLARLSSTCKANIYFHLSDETHNTMTQKIKDETVSGVIRN